MSDDQQLRADLDYAAYLFRMTPGTLEEAVSVSGLSRNEPRPRTIDPGHLPQTCARPRDSADYFAFYQENGRWAWRRVNPAESVMDASDGTFRHYLECARDAKRHGWKGKPLCLLLE